LICFLPLPSIKSIFSSLFFKVSSLSTSEEASRGGGSGATPLTFKFPSHLPFLVSFLFFQKKAQIIMLFFSNKCDNHKKLGLGLSFTFGSRCEIRSIVTKGRGNELQLQADNHSILCEDINLQRYNAGILCVKL